MDTSFLPQPNERQLAVLRDLSSQMKTREGDAYRDVNAYVSTSDYKDMHYAVKQHVLPFARNFDRLSETYLSAAPFNARLDRLPSHLGSVQNINRIINSVRLPFPVTVYRGMEDMIAMRKVDERFKKTALHYYRSQLQRGEVFTAPTLMSTSPHPDTAIDFASRYKSGKLGDRSILLQIELPAGFPGLPIFSTFEESEILLPFEVDGKPLRFISLGAKTGRHYMRAEKEWVTLTIHRIKPIVDQPSLVIF